MSDTGFCSDSGGPLVIFVISGVMFFDYLKLIF
jgi:hypothetical protein